MKTREVTGQMKNRGTTSRCGVWGRIILPLLVCLLIAVVIWLAVKNADGKEQPGGLVPFRSEPRSAQEQTQ